MTGVWNKNMRLNRKILIVTIGILALSLFASSAVNVLNFRHTYTDALLRGSFAIGHSINSVLKEMLALGLPLNSLTGMDKKLSEVVTDNPHIAYVGIADMDGVAIFHSDHSLVGHKFVDQVMRKSLTATEPTWQLYDRFDGNSYFDVTIPVLSANQTKVGAIRVGFPVAEVNEKVWDAIMQIVLNVLITFIATAIMLNLFLQRFISRPVAILSKHAE